MSGRYQIFDKALLATRSGSGDGVAYIICDHRALRQYVLGRALPFPMPIGRYVRSGELIRGRTLRGLATAAGINPAALEATVKAY